MKIGHGRRVGEIAEQREAYVIIQRDGSILRDLDGPEIQFETRAEAESWLMPGERCDSCTGGASRGARYASEQGGQFLADQLHSHTGSIPNAECRIACRARGSGDVGCTAEPGAPRDSAETEISL